MIPRPAAANVNVAGKAGVDHAAGAAAYAASKAAAIAMIDSLAADRKGDGACANSILPSIIDTAANRSAMPGAHFAAWPKPEDIARVILFLASADGKGIHGAAIPVYANIGPVSLLSKWFTPAPARGDASHGGSWSLFRGWLRWLSRLWQESACGGEPKEGGRSRKPKRNSKWSTNVRKEACTRHSYL